MISFYTQNGRTEDKEIAHDGSRTQLTLWILGPNTYALQTQEEVER